MTTFDGASVIGDAAVAIVYNDLDPASINTGTLSFLIPTNGFNTGLLNLVTNRFVITTSGYYNLTGVTSFAFNTIIVPANSIFTIEFRLFGTLTVLLTYSTHIDSNINDSITNGGANTVFLSAGDEIELVYTIVMGAIPVGGGALFNANDGSSTYSVRRLV